MITTNKLWSFAIIILLLIIPVLWLFRWEVIQNSDQPGTFLKLDRFTGKVEIISSTNSSSSIANNPPLPDDTPYKPSLKYDPANQSSTVPASLPNRGAMMGAISQYFEEAEQDSK